MDDLKLVPPMDEPIPSVSATPTTTIHMAAKRLRDELDGRSPAERLQIILMEISDESDALKETREHGAVDDPSVVSARRVTALKEMGNLIIQLDKLGMDINLEHPILKVYADYILDIFIKVLKANGFVQAQVDVVLSGLYGEMKDWEKEVDARYRAYRRDQMVIQTREDEKKSERKDQEKKQAKLAAVS